MAPAGCGESEMQLTASDVANCLSQFRHSGTEAQLVTSSTAASCLQWHWPSMYLSGGAAFVVLVICLASLFGFSMPAAVNRPSQVEVTDGLLPLLSNPEDSATSQSTSFQLLTALVVDHQLGRGHFGSTWKGHLRSRDGAVDEE
eukprot:5721680-Amphidinium_carterae.2